MSNDTVKPFTLKVTYTKYQKNKYRNDLRWYVRVTEKGEKPFDVCLDTEDETVADRWVRLRTNEVQTANDYALDEDVKKWQTALEMVTCQRNRNRDTTAIRKTNTEVVTLRQAANRYIDYCEKVKMLRPKTVENYQRALSTMFDRIEASAKPVFNLNQLTAETIVLMFQSFRPKFMPNRRANAGATKVTERTLNDYMSTMQRFTQWCAKTYKIDDVCEDLERPKYDKPTHPIWTFQQMMFLVHRTEPLALKCYYYTLAVTGCRNTELRLCKWEDLKGNINDGFFIQLKPEYCKGRRGRILPLPQPLVDLLAHLKRRNNPAPGDDLFKDVPKSSSHRSHILQKSLQELKLPYGTLHTFRHSLACYLFTTKKMDIKQVQALLGHSSAQTTLNIYIECMQDEEMKSAMANVYEDEYNMPSQMNLPEIMDLL